LLQVNLFVLRNCIKMRGRKGLSEMCMHRESPQTAVFDLQKGQICAEL